MQNLLKQKSNQQGYILVVALIAMLFIGAVFVASSNRSGTEERVAISQLHAASLESAIYAGLYAVERESEELTDKYDSANTACETFKSKLIDKLLDIKNTFQTAADNNPVIYWKLVKLGSCKEYTGNVPKVEKEFQFNLIAWQGDESKPISRITGNGTILIKDTATESNNIATGILGGLSQAIGDSAVKSSGIITVTGGANIFGNTVGNKIVVKGGAEIFDGNLAYQEIDLPNYMKDTSWYKQAEKILLNEAIKVDPLGLEKAMNESFYTDQDGKEILLNNLPKASVSDAFAKLEHGQKKEMGQFPFQQAKISPEKFEVYNADWRVEDHQEVDVPIYSPVSFLGENISLRVFDDFKINSGGSDPSLKVSGGRVILFIDGDVEMNSGASMQIDSDSSLTLIVTGKFKLTGGFKFLDEKDEEKGINDSAVNSKGEPLFTLLSANTKDAKAVEMTGGTMFFGVVYALSDLKLGGSGTIVGQAFGANIIANGGTAVNYQPSLGGGGSSGSGEGENGGSEFTPELDSNFEINY